MMRWLARSIPQPLTRLFWRVVDTTSQWLICKNIWMTPSVKLHIDFMCCPCLSMKACGVRQKGFSNEAIV
jgi:hypothetical protein